MKLTSFIFRNFYLVIFWRKKSHIKRHASIRHGTQATKTQLSTCPGKAPRTRRQLQQPLPNRSDGHPQIPHASRGAFTCPLTPARPHPAEPSSSAAHALPLPPTRGPHLPTSRSYHALLPRLVLPTTPTASRAHAPLGPPPSGRSIPAGHQASLPPRRLAYVAGPLLRARADAIFTLASSLPARSSVVCSSGSFGRE